MMAVGSNTWRRRTSGRSRRPIRPRSNPPTGISLLRPEIRKMIKGSSIVLVTLLAAATPSFAQEAPPPANAPAQAPAQPVQWSSLSPDQQKLLDKFSVNFFTLPPELQQALARGSNRWLGLSPEQRGQAQQRFQRWFFLLSVF